MIKLQHIEMLLAIEQTGSLRAASAALGKTQPALTKALRQAEADLGVSIFKRAPSGVTLTEDGQHVLRRARIIDAEMRKMRDEIAQRQGAGTGQLNVTVSPLAANRLIAPTIKLFRRRYPRVHVQIGGGHEPMAFSPIRDGMVDLVIGPEPTGADRAGLSVEFLVETPICIVTGASSRWRGATRLAELREGDWVMIGTRSRMPYHRKRFERVGVEPPDVTVTSDSIFSVLSMIQDSDLLCSFPGLVYDQMKPRWRIEALDLEDDLAPARISMMWAADRGSTPALRHFRDCVQQVAVNEFGPRAARGGAEV